MADDFYDMSTIPLGSAVALTDLFMTLQGEDLIVTSVTAQQIATGLATAVNALTPKTSSFVFGYISDAWYGPVRNAATSTSSYSATGAGTIMMLSPMVVAKGGVTITDLGFVPATNTATTAAWLHIFNNTGTNTLGSLVAAVQITGISTAIAAATLVSATLASPVPLAEGQYWFGLLPNGGVTSLQTLPTGIATQVLGTSSPADPDAVGARRPEIVGLTYGQQAGGGTITRNASSSSLPMVYFQAQ